MSSLTANLIMKIHSNQYGNRIVACSVLTTETVKDRWILSERLDVIYCEAFCDNLWLFILFLFFISLWLTFKSFKYEDEGIRDYGEIFKDCKTRQHKENCWTRTARGIKKNWVIWLLSIILQNCQHFQDWNWTVTHQINTEF